MNSPDLRSTFNHPRRRTRRARSRPAVFFALLCGLAFASSLLSVAAEADDSPVAVAISTLP